MVSSNSAALDIAVDVATAVVLFQGTKSSHSTESLSHSNERCYKVEDLQEPCTLPTCNLSYTSLVLTSSVFKVMDGTQRECGECPQSIQTDHKAT